MAHFTSSSAPSTVAQTAIVEIKDPETLSIPSVEYGHPEGGRNAWLTIAGAWMVQFCTYINAFGVYQDYYTRDFLVNKTAADISWVGSFQLATQYALGVIVGRAFDAGYFHHMMFIGSTFYVLCIFLLSLTQAGQFYQVFLAQAVGMGVFPALIFLPSFAIVSHHFRRRRVIAMGIVTSGAAWGGVIFPVMPNQLGKRTKLTTGIRVSGGMIGAMLLFANLTMKTRPAARLSKTGESPSPNWKSIFTDRGYLASLLGAFFTSLGLFYPFFYLQLYASTNGVRTELGLYLLTLLNGGSIFGRLVNNSLAPHIGSFNLVFGSLYGCAGLIFVMQKIKTFAGLASFAVLYGFTSDASLMPAIFVSFSDYPEEYAVRLAIAFSVVSPAILAGNTISGALLGLTGRLTWQQPIIFSAVAQRQGAVGIVESRQAHIVGGRVHNLSIPN
ncbi:major facilitator superfamily domain-containing protein [Favolaschia claudopus]|uniref:Major facilitator superfamily domain-containing protein n=1 Tax=Favolaschia claudopus TaxID=2862362 RepID=A0AAW0AIR7_9AGAR